MAKNKLIDGGLAINSKRKTKVDANKK